MSARAVCVVLIGLGSSAGVAAADERDVEREAPFEELFLGETAFPQDQWELQATTGVRWLRRDSTGQFAIPIELELGLTDSVQVTAAVPWAIEHADGMDSRGIGNAGVGAAIAVVDGRSSPAALLLGAETSFPSASGVGDDVWTQELFVAGCLQLGRMAAHASAGLELEHGGGAVELGGEAQLTLAARAGPVTPAVQVELALDDRLDLGSIAGGVIVHPADGWELGGAAVIEPGGDLAVGAILFASGEWELAGDDR